MTAHRDKSDLLNRIRPMRDQGKSFAEIGEALNISGERVRQLWKIEKPTTIATKCPCMEATQNLTLTATGAAPSPHPHTPDWFRDLYTRRLKLTPEQFYGEFWNRLQASGYKYLLSIRGVVHDADEFTHG